MLNTGVTIHAQHWSFYSAIPSRGSIALKIVYLQFDRASEQNESFFLMGDNCKCCHEQSLPSLYCFWLEALL